MLKPFLASPIRGPYRWLPEKPPVQRAVELDPLSLIINSDLGNNYFFARRYDEAIEQVRKTLEMDPNFYYAYLTLGQALDMKGARDAAIGEYQKARALNDAPSVLGLLAHAYVFSDNNIEAGKILDQLMQLTKQRYVPAYSFAVVYLGLGDKEQARGFLLGCHAIAGEHLAMK